jgi:flagellin
MERPLSSLLTNTSAMVALQTLKTINKNLGAAQNQISTGKQIATAKDNAAIWAITTVMSTDVSGFKAIGESLSLGDATLTVARDGAETVAGLLDQLKGKVVAAQEDNVDRTKIQADVDALREQIKTVVDAAQFNGLNLLKRQVADNDVSVLASLNRSPDGTVSSSSISFQRRTLEVGTVTTVTADVAEGDTEADVLTLGGAAGAVASTAFVVGDLISMEIVNAQGGGFTLAYSVTEADVTGTATVDTMAGKVITAFNAQLTSAKSSGAYDTTGYSFGAGTGAHQLTLTLAAGAVTLDGYQTATTGGLSPLDMIDVSSVANARAALTAMEPMIQSAISAAAAFGSAQGRIATQNAYISKIMDGLTSGIGGLVDADMEAASARLQALQVQQQLGIQALSIANQSPQNILALFQR